MRAWILMLLVPGLAGCADEIGNPPEGLVAGDCGRLYHSGLERQILIEVTFSSEVLRREPDADVTDVEVAAETDGEQYAEAFVAKDGCVRLPLQDEGAYTFWGFGFRDDGACWYNGYVRGLYQGEPVIESSIRLDRHCPS